MAYEMFQYQPNPNDYYRDLTQEYIDSQWDNTSAKTPENGGALLEQNGIGSNEYSCVQAWVAPTVATTSTGLNFIQLHYIVKYNENPLNCWKPLRAIMLKRRDEICSNVNA